MEGGYVCSCVPGCSDRRGDCSDAAPKPADSPRCKIVEKQGDTGTSIAGTPSPIPGRVDEAFSVLLSHANRQGRIGQSWGNTLVLWAAVGSANAPGVLRPVPRKGMMARDGMTGRDLMEGGTIEKTQSRFRERNPASTPVRTTRRVDRTEQDRTPRPNRPDCPDQRRPRQARIPPIRELEKRIATFLERTSPDPCPTRRVGSPSGVSKEVAMARVSPFHSKLSGANRYHDNDQCTEGNNIEKKNRVSGTGGHPKVRTLQSPAVSRL